MNHYIDDDDDAGLEGEESMLLDEEMDDDYEPTDQEIIEYAQFLGMDLNSDKEFFYIAKEGLKAPLPSNFKPYKRRTGEIVYVNLKTNEFQEEHPCDEYYRNLFIEAKRKKMQKTTANSKFKKNFPIGGSSATNEKAEPVQQMSKPLKNERDKGRVNLDKSHTSDQQDSFISNNLETSFSGMPAPLINKETKKTTTTTAKANQISFNLGMGMEVPPIDLDNQGGMEAVHQEYEDKFFEYYKTKEKEVTRARGEFKANEETYENKLQKNVDKDIMKLEEDLLAKSSEAKAAEKKEKEKLKENLKGEYKEKFESEVKKVDKAHFTEKREFSKTEENRIKEQLRYEEESLNEDYRQEEKLLTDKKNELEKELEQIKRKELQNNERYNEEIEDEKVKVIQNFKQKLREFETSEKAQQENDLKNFKKEFEVKLKDEMIVVENAKHQKKALASSKKDEMKEKYERKFIQEKEKLDNQITENLNQFEKDEKMKKENECARIMNQELKEAKEKKQSKLHQDVSLLKENHQKRLQSFQQILKEKYEKEVELINEATERSVAQMAKQVENIQLDFKSKDEVFREVQRMYSSEDALNTQVKESEQNILHQRNENEELQRKLKMKQSEYHGAQNIANQTLKELKEELRAKEREVQELLRKEKEVKKIPGQRASSQNQYNRSNVNMKESNNMALSKIMKELQEIKSFILPQEEEKSSSYLKVFRNDFSSKNPSKTLFNLKDSKVAPSPIPGSHVYEENSWKKKSKRSLEDWIAFYEDELNEIGSMKQKIAKDKVKMKKAQEYTVEEQEKFQNDFSVFKASSHPSSEKKRVLKKQKQMLNEYVQNMNDDIYRLKENEKKLKIKEKSLVNFGKTLQKTNERGFDPSQIESAYRNYQESRFSYKSPTSLKTKLSENVFPPEESKGFYEKWENLIENQMSLEVSETDDQRPLEEKNNLQNGTQYFKTQFFESTEDFMDRAPETVGNTFYDSRNRIKILDLKLREKLNTTDNDYAKRHLYQSTESRYRMNEIFTQQSQWLKNMKNQLNSQLYDRSGNSSTFVSRFL